MEIQKNKPIRLNRTAYRKLQEKVLERDDYTCQLGLCRERGYTLPIDPPHHIVYKSRGGSDTMDNLITLCHYCHSQVHSKNIKLKEKL